MASGRMAFSGPTLKSVLTQQLTTDPPLVPLTQPDVTPELVAVVRRSLAKQPGDQMAFTVMRDGKSQNVNVLLDGGAMPIAEIPPGSASAVKVGPQLKARRGDSGEITIRDNNTLAEVAVDPDRGQTRRSVGNEAELLRLQLEAYERVFERMQKEIDSLRRETSNLQERLKERKQ